MKVYKIRNKESGFYISKASYSTYTLTKNGTTWNTERTARAALAKLEEITVYVDGFGGKTDFFPISSKELKNLEIIEFELKEIGVLEK